MRNQRGEGGLKIIISLALLAYGIFCAVKIVGAKGDDKAVEKKMEEVLKFAGTKNAGLVDMEYQIGLLVKEYNVPVNVEEEVEVYEEDNQFHSELSYVRKVSLGFWTWTNPVKIHVKYAKY